MNTCMYYILNYLGWSAQACNTIQIKPGSTHYIVNHECLAPTLYSINFTHSLVSILLNRFILALTARALQM